MNGCGYWVAKTIDVFHTYIIVFVVSEAHIEVFVVSEAHSIISWWQALGHALLLILNTWSPFSKLYRSILPSPHNSNITSLLPFFFWASVLLISPVFSVCLRYLYLHLTSTNPTFWIEFLVLIKKTLPRKELPYLGMLISSEGKYFHELLKIWVSRIPKNSDVLD